MNAVKLYHNPRCSKSRQALALLEENGVTPELRLYMDEPLSITEVQELLQRLGIPAGELLRSGEEACKRLGLSPASPEEAIIRAMVDEPRLMQRPIAVTQAHAVVGRPPERVLELLA